MSDEMARRRERNLVVPPADAHVVDLTLLLIQARQDLFDTIRDFDAVTRERDEARAELAKRKARRAPVQASTHDFDGKPRPMGAPGVAPGTVSWDEHVAAWLDYSRCHGRSQSAERIAERWGFSYLELVSHLGHEPKTWEPL